MGRASVYVLVFAVSMLSALGLVMLASTSYFLDETSGEAYFTLRSQIIRLGIGVLAAGVMAFIAYPRLYRLRWKIFGVTVVALLLCYVPFFADEVNGAARWISLKRLGIGGPNLQPSELAKLAIAILLAGWFTRHEPLTREFKQGFLMPGCMVFVTVALIAGEVDLGSAALVGALGGGMMFVAGTRLMYLLPILGAGLGGLAWVVKFMPNRVERIFAFLDLEKYKEGLGMQQWRALIAFGSGGVEGVGLGNGRQKMLYLPEAHTDFIFPMVGEELGLYGTLFVVITFSLLIAAGMSIAHRAPDRFSRLLAFGITLTIALEALLNMGVTTALLPNKGLPLPFVSYGGSSLVFRMIGIGILINIYRQTPYERKKDLLEIRRRRMTAVSHGSL
ncbi:putative peptidoglycan glycosyltransferase FtsW [Verrucomicrobium sp. BvORR106]|uniref:FtsW/RodA/SpoVE family cell cycle protein n=1 Tax=Verrucomicrobium sp. BvORR106 TaxID=1403819 RepID=UPI00069246EE|nr:putative peptidoglycan glycosyltransferase FtsW [Verrucomicrobium sp. BvORR106]